MRLKMLIALMACGICFGAITPLNQDKLENYLSSGAPFDFIPLNCQIAEILHWTKASSVSPFRNLDRIFSCRYTT